MHNEKQTSGTVGDYTLDKACLCALLLQIIEISVDYFLHEKSPGVFPDL